MCYNKLIRFLIHRKELFMAVCYKKLWKLLIDKNMNKTELRMASGITTTALAKLGRDENVNTEVLAKICQTLDCKIEDIMELVPEDKI
jgi:DNA-binding Xre family transcriptional regulator